MGYFRCFLMGLLMALAGAFGWLVNMFTEAYRSVPPEARGGGVAIDIRSLFDNRALLIILVAFLVGFFIEFLILKRGLLKRAWR